jgi:flagellar assembly factor FliW
MEQTKTYKLSDGAEFTEDDIFYFKNGIPGFERLHRFVLSALPGQEPFKWLNSVDDPSLRFVVLNPLEIDPEYSPKFEKSQGDDLQIEKPEDMLIFVIITIKEVFHESTANMAGPIVLNVKRRLGKQIILDDSRYIVRHAFMQNRGGQ